MSTTLVYASTCAADATGKPGAFLAQELPLLVARFDRVLVCGPNGIATVAQSIPENLPFVRPAYANLRGWLRAPWCAQFWREVYHLMRDHALRPVSLGKLLLFTVRGYRMHYWIEAMLRDDKPTTLYAFWSSYDAFAVALSKRRHPTARAIARAHAFDIDPARNPMNPYLMKRFLGETLDGLYPISIAARTRLLACAPFPQQKVHVLFLGSSGAITTARMPAPLYTDGVFRIVSCASLVPLKQVPLLIDALALWRSGRVRWLHIGGGAEESAVRAYAAAKLGSMPQIEYTITGHVSAAQVQQFYDVQPFDVFINTSKSEGVPVSIMEAMRVGLPIIAPAIGGIPELVDASFGMLYSPDGGAQAVHDALATMATLSQSQAEALRAASQVRWNEQCRSEALVDRLL